MKKYRLKLLKFLVEECGLAKSSAIVYLAGTNNKRPNGDIRYLAEKKLKHPFSMWGKNIIPYLQSKEQK